MPRAAASGCSRIEITSDDTGTFATFVGLSDGGQERSDPGNVTGKDVKTGFTDPNLRPNFVGVFTDLKGPAPQGLSLSATVDTRFTTSPTALKLGAMLLAIIATVIAVVALWRLDQRDGRRASRLVPSRWRTFTATDVVVVGGFLLWHVIGANSSDDGYILQMARVAQRAGYMSNYFRWFGSPEDPFGWFYNVLALMTHVSDASLWMRLPDLFCALLCWLLLSREVLPRLGPSVANSRSAMWAAGLVLMAAWMPFNNGLRPEGQIATGALITYVLIERAIISGRLTPAALAIVSAAFTLGIQPTGLIAVAALLAGGRPLLRILVRRRRDVGVWPLVLPLLAAGTIVLTVVFADQTAATVLEATRIRTAIGPSQAWYTENLRYYYLILPTVDGSLSRRFGFLITALSLFTSLFIMLRRKRVPGVARGPVWRLAGIIFGTMFFLMFAPTKWVHHFGLFAAVGAAMAAVATVLVSPLVLRSARNRMAFVAALLFVLALTFSSTNGWWYVSSYGVPFNNAMPKVAGVTVSTIVFVLFGVAALWAFWLHFARDRGESRVVRWVTAAPIPITAGLMVVVFVGSMLAGVVRQYPTYSNGASNLAALADGCGLADDVLVEPDGNAGFLPAAARRLRPAGPARWGGTRRLHAERRSGSHRRRGDPERSSDAGHRLRLGQAGQADEPGRRRLDGAAALRPRSSPGPVGGQLRRRPGATAEPPDLGVVPAAQCRCRTPAGRRHRRRQHHRQQRVRRPHRRTDRRPGVRAVGSWRCTRAGGAPGSLRHRPHPVVAQSALRSHADPPTRPGPKGRAGRRARFRASRFR